MQSIALTIGFFLYIGFEFDTHEQIENKVPSQQKLGKQIYSEKYPHYLENNINLSIMKVDQKNNTHLQKNLSHAPAEARHNSSKHDKNKSHKLKFSLFGNCHLER